MQLITTGNELQKGPCCDRAAYFYKKQVVVAVRGPVCYPEEVLNGKVLASQETVLTTQGLRPQMMLEPPMLYAKPLLSMMGDHVIYQHSVVVCDVKCD